MERRWQAFGAHGRALEDVRAAERRMDLAAEVARAREIMAATLDLENLDAA